MTTSVTRARSDEEARANCRWAVPARCSITAGVCDRRPPDRLAIAFGATGLAKGIVHAHPHILAYEQSRYCHDVRDGKLSHRHPAAMRAMIAVDPRPPMRPWAAGGSTRGRRAAGLGRLPGRRAGSEGHAPSDGRAGRAATVPRVNRHIAIPLVAAATFVAGFGVAELTGVRAIGGLVLLAGGAWCGRATLPIAGPRGTVALLAIALGLFVVSHPLGEAIGAWPAVAVTAVLAAVAAAALLGLRTEGPLAHLARPPVSARNSSRVRGSSRTRP